MILTSAIALVLAQCPNGQCPSRPPAVHQTVYLPAGQPLPAPPAQLPILQYRPLFLASPLPVRRPVAIPTNPAARPAAR